MKNHIDATKPVKPYEHRITTADGKTLDVHGGNVSGAWLELPGTCRYLSVVSARSAGGDFIQYSDGKHRLPKLALAVADDGQVTLQYVLEGVGVENNRVRFLTLDELETLISGQNPAPQ